MTKGIFVIWLVNTWGFPRGRRVITRNFTTNLNGWWVSHWVNTTWIQLETGQANFATLEVMVVVRSRADDHLRYRPPLQWTPTTRFGTKSATNNKDPRRQRKPVNLQRLFWLFCPTSVHDDNQERSYRPLPTYRTLEMDDISSKCPKRCRFKIKIETCIAHFWFIFRFV